MYSVKVTTTADTAWTVAGDVRAVRRFGSKAEARMKRAIEKERTGHKYTNRSGDAEALTTVSLVSDDGQGNVEFDAEMAVPYASYLQGKWSQFDENVEEAIAAIDAEFNKL
jgi:hypothetical protein